MAKNEYQSRFIPSRVIAVGYLLAITIAEYLVVFVDARYGLWIHLILFIVMVFLGIMDRSRPLSRLWLASALAPLIRVISLATPLTNFRILHWYLLTGLPIFLSAFALFRYLRLPRERFGLQANWSLGQWLVGLTGLGLGYVEYIILQPKPLISETSFLAALEALLILVIFTGLAEEVIFRGLMQHAAERVFGGAGVVYVAGIFAVLHLGYRSLADLIFVFLVALYFGYYVRRTRSIFGVTLAHGLTNVSLFLIFPFIVGQAAVGGEDVGPSVISPPRATLTITPTPFMPYTPTPFMPVEPTPMENGTPTPEVTPGIETVEPTVTPSLTEEISALFPAFPDINGTIGHSYELTVSQSSSDGPTVDWHFWRLCAKLIHSSQVERPNALRTYIQILSFRAL